MTTQVECLPSRLEAESKCGQTALDLRNKVLLPWVLYGPRNLGEV